MMTAYEAPIWPGHITWQGCHAVPARRGSDFLGAVGVRRPTRSFAAHSAPRASLGRNSSESSSTRGDDRHDAKLSVPETRRSSVNNKKVYIVSKISMRTEVVETQEIDTKDSGSGLFGVQAKAYWDSIGVFPLAIAAFGVTALVLKMVKVKKGEWTAASEGGGVNRAVVHASVVTNEKEEAELHVFKCGGCGYEIYPARGREFKFFGDDFKCPCCGAPKSEFWDRNDPNDPRNDVSDEDEEDEDEEEDVDEDDHKGPSGKGSGIPDAGPSKKVVAQNKSPPSSEDVASKS